MRGIKSGLISILTIGLLAGSAVGVAAQEGPVEVTGSSDMPSGCIIESSDGMEGFGTRSRFTCGPNLGMTWSMSDPRMEGTVVRISESSKVAGEWPVDTQIRAIAIENSGGSWRERPRFVVTFPGHSFAAPFPDSWMSVFDGEDGYEGLVAVFQVRHEAGTGQTYHGYIVDERLLPVTPETASTTR